MAGKTSKNETSCSGCLIALIGLCFLPAFPVGTIIGVLLIIVGNGMGQKLLCSKCGNPITEESKMCPTCRENFD